MDIVHLTVDQDVLVGQLQEHEVKRKTLQRVNRIFIKRDDPDEPTIPIVQRLAEDLNKGTPLLVLVIAESRQCPRCLTQNLKGRPPLY